MNDVTLPISSNISGLLKAMEDVDRKKDEKFCFTESLFDLQKTCPIHHVGYKDIFAQRYTCPTCGIYLAKKLKIPSLDNILRSYFELGS